MFLAAPASISQAGKIIAAYPIMPLPRFKSGAYRRNWGIWIYTEYILCKQRIWRPAVIYMSCLLWRLRCENLISRGDVHPTLCFRGAIYTVRLILFHFKNKHASPNSQLDFLVDKKKVILSSFDKKISMIILRKASRPYRKTNNFNISAGDYGISW